jgi:hypothetical protein
MESNISRIRIKLSHSSADFESFDVYNRANFSQGFYEDILKHHRYLAYPVRRHFLPAGNQCAARQLHDRRSSMGDQWGNYGGCGDWFNNLGGAKEISKVPDSFQIGDRVQIFLDPKVWGSEGWFDGTVVRIDPYTQHRSFYWVELDDEAEARLGKRIKLISVLNPRNIRKA